MKKIIVLLGIVTAFSACDKDTNPPITYTPPAPVFRATISGTETILGDKITATSEQLVQGGPYMLRISAEKKITADSSTLVQFILEDFTRDGSTENKNITLSTNKPGYFIESNNKLHSTYIKYHFSQTGQLTINKIGADYINGNFQFTYFIFDQYGHKISEHHIQNGTFQNVKIKRIN